MTEPEDTTLRKRGSPLEVLRVFLKLGLTSFGGPIAHIGYFRDEFVVRRRWLDEQAFADLVGLCQFLPGPASSQVGFSIGLMRAGFPGALAAWTGFTLPSAIALVLFAYGAGALAGPTGIGLLHGLKLVAVAIIAQAVWGMARTLTPDRERASIATVAALIILFSASSAAQIAAIALGGFAGLWLCRSAPAVSAAHVTVPVSRTIGFVALSVFFLLLVGLPLVRGLGPSQGITLFDAFYRSGALVFGGGHVVLPLLREAFVTPSWIADDNFLSGYGAAQAVPGPLFAFAAYLGTVVNMEPHGVAGAALGLIAIFLPGMWPEQSGHPGKPGEIQFWRLAHIGATLFIKFRIEGMPLYVIATDGHPLSRPRRLTEVFIGPGERIDALVLGPPAGEYAMRTIPFQNQAWRAPDPAQQMASIVASGAGTSPQAGEAEIMAQRYNAPRWIDEVRYTDRSPPDP